MKNMRLCLYMSPIYWVGIALVFFRPYGLIRPFGFLFIWPSGFGRKDKFVFMDCAQQLNIFSIYTCSHIFSWQPWQNSVVKSAKSAGNQNKSSVILLSSHYSYFYVNNFEKLQICGRLECVHFYFSSYVNSNFCFSDGNLVFRTRYSPQRTVLNPFQTGFKLVPNHFHTSYEPVLFFKPDFTYLKN